MPTPYGMRTPLLARLMRRPFEWFARAVLRVWCPLKVEGGEYLPQLPFIICSNHNSHMDCVVLMTAAGASFRHFAMLAASDYFFRSAFVFNFFSAMVTMIPVDRSPHAENFRRSLSMCRAFVGNRPRGLILFPEGTRSRSGAIGPFRRGASLFAAQLGVPVVPAHVTGTREALPVGSFFPKRHSVSVRFARPVYPPDGGSREQSRRVLDTARERILSLEAQANGA